MTRKHYIQLARVIHGFKYEMTAQTYANLVWQVGGVMKSENGNFDMERWEDACGLTDELVATV